MKFVVHSQHGDGIALAPRLLAEGNEVSIYMEKGKRSYANLGIPTLERFDPAALDADTVVVFDMVGHGRLADTCRARGLGVVGSSAFGDRLELDRAYGALVMEAVGIKIPPTHVFTSFAEGIRHADSAKGGLFFKPHGNKSTALTFGDDDPTIVAKMLRHYESRWEGPIAFELQEKVEGIELSIEGWFNGHDWMVPFNSTFEDKRLHAGDLGPHTGSMSSVVFAYQHQRPKVARETLLRLTTILRKAKYVGPLDINTKGGYGLEFTARFGYDALWALIELMQVDVGKVLADLARGQLRRQLPLSRDYAFALRLMIPKDEGDVAPRGLPVTGVKFGDPHVWLLDVMGSPVGELVTAGVDGVIGVVTGTGRTVEEARQQVFQRASEINVPNMFYRVDAGARARRQLKSVLDTYVEPKGGRD